MIPGGFGVTVFFFLSGYLITTLLRREFEATGTVSFRKFYWRRVWRIFPPMYTALVFATAVSLAGLTLGTPTVEAVSLQALHLTNYAIIDGQSGDMPFGSQVFWSLAIEEHFYLLFPVVALFLLRRFDRRHQALALLATCGLVLCWRIALVTAFGASPDRIFYATDTRIDAILFGCAMGLYHNPMLDGGALWSKRKALGAAAASTLVVVVTMVVRHDLFRETLRYSIQSMALAPLFYAAIQHPGLGPFRWLNLKPVRFVGVLSYSLYLVHHVVILAIWKFQPTIPTPIMIVVAGPIALALAYVIYRVVEQPSARIRRRYASM